MTKVLLTIIIIIFSVLTLQSQTKDTVYIVEKDTVFITEPESKIVPVKYELGVLLGTPGKYNLMASAHTGDFLFKVSGSYFGYPSGGQVEVGYKIFETDKIYYSVSTGVGTVVSDPAIKKYGLDNLREYFTINFIYCNNGFYICPGLSVDYNDIYYPQLVYQIGYAYQFR